MQAGKTTAANILKHNYGFHRIAFADILKKMIVDAGLLTNQQIKDKDPEARFMLQRVGTEIIRKVDPDYFVKEMEKKFAHAFKYKYHKIVIDDVRFLNEADIFTKYGGKLVLINRRGNMGGNTQPELEKHRSEQEYEHIAISMVVYNRTTLEEFENSIIKLVEDYKWTK
jgi:dephospho-CoA kinase